MNVGIIGYGYVGQAVDSIIDDKAKIVIYDKNKPKYKNNLFDITQTDIVFICVSTPNDENGKLDASQVIETLLHLRSVKYAGLVIVKSTVMHYVLEQFTDELNLVFNPEFLNQNTFLDDAYYQKVIVIGGTANNIKTATNFYLGYTKTNEDELEFETCTLKEACDFKYVRNLYSAYKLLFWEFVHDTTGNSRKMGQLYEKLPLNDVYMVGMDGFRGFGGACLPKDVQAWDYEHNHSLSNFMLGYNKKINKE